MKATIEMNDAEFNDYRSMRDKIDDPNYVDITQLSIDRILLMKGCDKGETYTDDDIVTGSLVEQIVYKKRIEPRVDCEIVIRYIHKR